MIGCDGIFEQMTSRQVINCVWERISDQTSTKQIDVVSPRQKKAYDEHIAVAEGVEIGLR